MTNPRPAQVAEGRHEPWCDTQLGPDFEVVPGSVVMTLHLCTGCKGEPAPTPTHRPARATTPQEK